MDYKFTFEDGSEAIMHYGVKGMKWRHRKQQSMDSDADLAELDLKRTMDRETAAKTLRKNKIKTLSWMKKNNIQKTNKVKANMKRWDKQDRDLLKGFQTKREKRMRYAVKRMNQGD